jgi:CMP/dCMP kinase
MMAVITISRQFGSGGDEIANRVCEVLGYQQFDKRQIIQAAAEAGLSENEVVDYSEENHKVRTFLDRLFNRSIPLAQVRVWHETSGGVRAAEEVRLSEDVVLSLVQKSIRSAYRMGNFVIVGRGGQVILRNYREVVHVRIVAAEEDRIQIVKEQIKQQRQDFGADIEARRQAQDLITERDAASHDYIRRFYDAEWDDPQLYHLVINTSKVGVEQAVALITRLAQEIKPQPASYEQAEAV